MRGPGIRRLATIAMAPWLAAVPACSTASASGAGPPPEGWAGPPGDTPPPGPVAALDTVALSTDRLAVGLDPATGAVTIDVLDGAGDRVHRAVAPALLVDGVQQTDFRSTGPSAVGNAAVDVRMDALGPRAIAVTWSARDGARHDFELQLLSDDQTSYYGTGERFNALNQRGYTLPVITDDRYGNKGTGSHKPVPFFMSSRGFGVWVDTWAPGSLDLSATRRFTSALRFPERQLRVVFFAGPSLADILEAYTALTGRSPVPPPWAFALWKSRDVHHTADSVYADIQRLREYGIPASVLVIDSPWETGYNTFEVNRVQFPDPEGMFARVRELGFEPCLWLTPFINDSNVQDAPGIDAVSDNFQDAAAARHLVEHADGRVALEEWWKGRGGLVDFTDPAAIDYWHGLLRKTRRWGVRAFKVDDGEGNFVPDAAFADGSSALEMKNRYSVLYDSVMQAYVEDELEGDGVLIVRSGYTGVQRYPFAWAGDNRGSFAFDDGLPSVILAGQTAAMSGISLWGHDIAGYAGRPTREVFVRWTQLGTFSPFMQVHMTSNQGPWDFGDEALDIFRRFARLRVRLFPYLYDAVHETARSGLPVIRPMALAFQDDPEAAGHIYQYMFGPDLLVAPVYRPGEHRSVYLPAGGWVDFWSGERFDGPAVMEVHAPLDRVPLFVRAGAILPLLPEGIETLVRRHDAMADDIVALDDRRVLEVWPGGPGGVRTWDGLAAELSVEDGRAVLRVESPDPRPVEVRLRGRRLAGLEVPGGRVRVDGGVTTIAFPMLEGRRTLEWEDGRP
jgi:alpha-D-xyloside xylohydrolase